MSIVIGIVFVVEVLKEAVDSAGASALSLQLAARGKYLGAWVGWMGIVEFNDVPAFFRWSVLIAALLLFLI